MIVNRREFLVLGGSALPLFINTNPILGRNDEKFIPLLATKPPAHYKINFKNYPTFSELSLLVGLQQALPEQDFVFRMRTKYNNINKENAEAQFLSDEVIFNEMAFIIDRAKISTGTAHTVKKWRNVIIQKLYDSATYKPLITEELEPGKQPYGVRRRRTWIAKLCRRGCGNVIVASRKAIESLQLTHNDAEKQYTEQYYKSIIVEEGEIMEEPFALIGYSGSSPYDQSMVMAIYNNIKLPNNQIAGAISPEHDIVNYWVRII